MLAQSLKVYGAVLTRIPLGAISCPIEQQGIVFSSGTWLEDGGRLRRAIIVVCGTNEMDDSVDEKYTFNDTELTKSKWDKNTEVVGWESRGVYAWDDVEPSLEMRIAKNDLIVQHYDVDPAGYRRHPDSNE